MLNKERRFAQNCACIFLCAISGALLYAPANQFDVDFDTSMGAYDAQKKSLYKDLKKNLTNHKSDWFRYIKPGVKPKSFFLTLKNSYNNNKLRVENSLLPIRIPRVFHQIWIGPRPFPEKYKRWQKTWQSIPGWTYKLWTDKEVEQFPFFNKAAFYAEKNLGARADILRLEILYREGGVYVDTDFECLKPEIFNVLNSSYDFYCGMPPLELRLLINNAIIGAVPKHPIIQGCLEYIPVQQANTKPDDIVARGPGLFTLMVARHMNKGHRDIVFPPTFFYPLGIMQLQNDKAYENLPFSDETLERVKRDVVKPESIAIHWWDGSWHGQAGMVADQ